MARTSKKNQTVYGTEPEKVYSAGIYARLSVDSNERKNESIETQVEIAKEFISQRKDMKIFRIYTDIGKTGTDFEREGFEHMMRDVRMRKIDCIVVKDLSRFGRNHIETGNYIEKIFPFMGVRFIAVTDGFDSMDTDGQNETLSINLKNLVNEMYARDIAVKVKSSRRAKWEQGSYTGGVPPYGYRAEWIGDKKCLFVEENTSEIVKKIYALFLSGKNMKEIVQWLYENRIVRPAKYHKTGQIYCQEKDMLEQWSASTVKMLLTNPVYMGCLVQGRTCGKDYMMRGRHDIGSEDWSVKEHTHEALVSEKLFFKAAEKFEKYSQYCNKDGFSKTVPQDEDIFAGILYCGDCGLKMKRISWIKTFSEKRKVRIYSYVCPRSDRIDEFKCGGKNISLYRLTGLVKKAIWQEFALSAMRPAEIIEASSREAEVWKEEGNRQLAEIEKETDRIKKIGSEQYLRFRMGEMSEECFKRAKKDNDKKVILLQRKKAAVTAKLEEIDTQTARKNYFLRALMKGDEKGGLTADAVRTLVDRIEVYTDNRVKIIFAFKRKDILQGKEATQMAEPAGTDLQLLNKKGISCAQ